jgi:hypothetical protein
MDGSPLDNDVTGFQMDFALVELHVKFSGKDNAVIEGVGPMPALRNSRFKVAEAENGAIRQTGSQVFPLGWIVFGQVRRQAVCRPQVRLFKALSPRYAFNRRIPFDHTAPVFIMSSHHSSRLHRFRYSPFFSPADRQGPFSDGWIACYGRFRLMIS